MLSMMATPAFAETPVDRVEVKINFRHGSTPDNADKWISCSTPGVKVEGVEFHENKTGYEFCTKSCAGLEYRIDLYLSCLEGYSFAKDAKVVVTDVSAGDDAPTVTEYSFDNESSSPRVVLRNFACCGNIFERFTGFLHMVIFTVFGIE